MLIAAMLIRGKSVPPAALAADVQWRLHLPLAVGLAAMHISMVESAERCTPGVSHGAASVLPSGLREVVQACAW